MCNAFACNTLFVHSFIHSFISSFIHLLFLYLGTYYCAMWEPAITVSWYAGGVIINDLYFKVQTKTGPKVRYTILCTVYDIYVYICIFHHLNLDFSMTKNRTTFKGNKMSLKLMK